MFLDSMVDNLSSSIFRYDAILGYLGSRLVTQEEIKKYRIGYSKVISVPDDGSPDRARFMEESWKGKKFEDRIIFPIQDTVGRVVGIIGRSHTKKDFKEFETEEAKFSGFFYGLYQALPRIYETGKVYVVEGTFDTHALAKVFPNTVGSLTAGLFETQHDLLSMFADRIITVFDADKAGRESAEKAQKRWGNVWDLNLGYKDPDECLKTLGYKGFQEYVIKKENRIFLF